MPRAQGRAGAIWSGIAASRFRANPECELVVYDRLPPDQRRAVARLARAPDFYGIVVARDPARDVARGVDRETALLFLTLRDPGRLPAYVARLLGEQCDAVVGALVLDRVLEVERHGTFVSGPEAIPAPLRDAGDDPDGGVIARLSLDALRYAAALPLRSAPEVAGRLYRYNAEPLTPAWARRLGSAADVLAYLGATHATARVLARWWSRTEPGGWLMWGRRRGPVPPGRARAPRKLYVSPTTSALPVAFPAVVATLAGLGAPPFKIGSSALGLLRPDKLVVYVDDDDELRRTADALAGALAGVGAQGVPFTAPSSSDGLLSWGVDPTAVGGIPEAVTSWRVWLTQHLATSLVAAAAAGEAEPWRVALARLPTLGVDPRDWTPTRTLRHDGELGA
jgi:hypothetical protein